MPIRVLIVDDSVAVRRLTTMALSEEPAIEVVGTTVHGGLALEQIPQLSPDVMVLDLEMPVMNGLETLIEVRRRHPELIVIMFSNYTLDGASVTIEALSRGAADYLAKPVLTSGPESSIQAIRSQLVPKILGLCQQSTLRALQPPLARSTNARTEIKRAQRRVDIVAIGTSVGGPAVLSKILKQLPPEFPVPIVIVQHMPPLFTQQLAENLASKTAIEVHEAKAGEELRPGVVAIAPGDFHLVVKRDQDRVLLDTHRGPHVLSCRPAVDELFSSVARVFGPHVLGVVLTGMGLDGLRGSEEICEAGGRVIVQDKDTCVVWGMAGCVAQAGLADVILSPNDIALELVQSVSHHRTVAPTKPSPDSKAIDAELAPADSEFLRELVYQRSGIRLGEEKDYLLRQRLQPLLNKHACSNIGDLVGLLRRVPSGHLHSDVVEVLATHETLFFRDLHPFELLKKFVLPELFEKREGKRRLKIWSIGCSSGQEPYSVAMLLREHFPRAQDWDIEIVGADLSPAMIERARAGSYNQLEVNRGLPARLLVKFFESVGDEWVIAREIRDMVQFRELNLANPLPAAERIDVILLRNVLIYFDEQAKKAALEKVRAMLQPDGFLFLGTGETPLSLGNTFEQIKLDKGGYYQLRDQLRVS